MKSLGEIRKAASKRSDRTTIEGSRIIKVATKRQARGFTESVEKVKKEDSQIINEKKKLVNRLNDEIDRKKAELSKAAEGIVAEATAKARKVKEKAEADAAEARSLKAKMKIEQEVLKKTVQKANENAQDATTLLANLEQRSASMKRIEDELLAKQIMVDKSVEGAKQLLGDIAGVLGVLFTRIDSAELLGQSGKDYVKELVGIMETANRVFNDREVKLEAQAEQNDKQKRQNKLDSDIIKEQRRQLRMASKEIYGKR